MTSSNYISDATKFIQEGNFAAAEALLNDGPDEAPAQQLMGVVCFQTGRIQDAIKQFERAAEELTEDGFLQNNLGQAYRAIGDIEAACAAFAKAAKLQPDFADPLNYLAQLQRKQDELDAAEQSFLAALERRPGYAEAHFNYAIILQESGRLKVAQDQYQLALAAKPDYVQAYNNLGTVLDEMGDHVTAMQTYLKGLEIAPDTPEILVSLGSCYRLQARYDDAVSAFEKAIALAPDHIEAKWNLGFLQLALGECAEGWANYRYRHSVDRAVHPLPSTRLSERLDGQIIEISPEQGLGDEIFFLRFALAAVERGAVVQFQPDQKLASLIERVDGVTVGPVADDAITMADLPYLLGTDDALLSITIPPDDQILSKMRSRLEAAGPGPYIGVTYRAGGAGKDTLAKDAPIDGIGHALLDINATIINVQRLPEPKEQNQLTEILGRDLVDFSDINDDLESALALMALLDDYIGVSNTNMHLRAAVGRKARVLVTHPGEYRWLVEGDHSPWFPEFDLYRQKPSGHSGGTWEGAFAKLASDIKANYEQF